MHVDERVDVRRRLLRGNVPGSRQQPDDLDVRVVECKRNGERGVDPRIGNDDDLAWHANRVNRPGDGRSLLREARCIILPETR